MALSQTKHTVEFSNNTHTPTPSHPKTTSSRGISYDPPPARGNFSSVGNSLAPVKPGSSSTFTAHHPVPGPPPLGSGPLPGGSDKVTRECPRNQIRAVVAGHRPIRVKSTDHRVRTRSPAPAARARELVPDPPLGPRSARRQLHLSTFNGGLVAKSCRPSVRPSARLSS